MESGKAIKPYERGDEENIFKLVTEVQGWEVPEEEQWMEGWRWMYVENPARTFVMWLAKDGDKLVGQYPVISENMKIGDEIIKGGQLVDTMTHPEYRRQGICTTLGRKALSEVENQKISLLFCFPTQQVYPVHMKGGWLDVCAFQRMFKPLNLEDLLRRYITHRKILLSMLTLIGNLIIKGFFRTRTPSGINSAIDITEVSYFDKRFDDFWERVSKDYQIAVVRDTKYLNWRYIDAPNRKYTVYVAERGGKICGYMVLGCLPAKGGIAGYIYDLVSPLNEENIIRCLIQKAIEHFSEEKASVISTRMVANKVYQKSLLKCGFIPYLRSKNRFIVYNVSSKLSPQFINNPENWFIQHGDLPLIY